MKHGSHFSWDVKFLTELLSFKRAIHFLPSLWEQAELLLLQPDWTIQLLPHSGLLPTPGAQNLISRQVRPFGSQPSSQIVQVTIGCTQDSISFHLLLALTKSSSPSQKGKALKTPQNNTKKKPKPKTKPTNPPNKTVSRRQQIGKKERGCKVLHLKRFTQAQKLTCRRLEGGSKNCIPESTHHSLKLSRQAADTTGLLYTGTKENLV